MLNPLRKSPWRIVLDTASFVCGIRSAKGAARELLRRIAAGELIACMDYKLSLEYRDVMLRHEHLQAAKLTFEEMEDVIDTFEANAEGVRKVKKLRPISSDPNDDMIIELAIAAQADAIVTNNVRHLSVVTALFGIPVITSAQMLRELRKGAELGRESK